MKHDYFGTQKILKDLKKMNGWESGYVTLSNNCLIRDPLTTLVVGLRENLKLCNDSCNSEIYTQFIEYYN